MYFYSTNEEQLKNMNKIAFLCKKKKQKTQASHFLHSSSFLVFKLFSKKILHLSF